MSIVVAIFAILGSAATALGGLAGLLWWTYKRGMEEGKRQAGQAEDKAKIEALERQVAELASMLPATRS